MGKPCVATVTLKFVGKFWKLLGVATPTRGGVLHCSGGDSHCNAKSLYRTMYFCATTKDSLATAPSFGFLL